LWFISQESQVDSRVFFLAPGYYLHPWEVVIASEFVIDALSANYPPAPPPKKK